MWLIARTRTAAPSASVAQRNARLPPSSSQDFYNLDYLNHRPSFSILHNSCGWESMWAFKRFWSFLMLPSRCPPLGPHLGSNPGHVAAADALPVLQRADRFLHMLESIVHCAVRFRILVGINIHLKLSCTPFPKPSSEISIQAVLTLSVMQLAKPTYAERLPPRATPPLSFFQDFWFY